MSDLSDRDAAAPEEPEDHADPARDEEGDLGVELVEGTDHALATDVAPQDPRSDVERERDEYLDALRRLQADFENYKKRVERQFEDLSARGVASLVSSVLPVLDALDLAEDHLLAEKLGEGGATTETRALVQARALLLDTLEKQGLERVVAQGEPFDPTVHDAVAHVEGDDGPVVDEVLRAGYRWRGQVLRPAMVKVRG